MDLCKKCLIIVVGISNVIADYDHELYKTLNLNDAKHPPLKPWFLDDFPSYLPEPSETITHYAYTYPYDNIEHSSSFIPIYSDDSPSSSSDSFFSSTKKIPKENKNYKKSISPYSADKETNFKDILKSGSSYCQEIKSKETGDGKLKPTAMTCYNCKDPKRGSSYEYCSYSTQPETDKSKTESKEIPPRFRRSDNYGAGSVSAAYVQKDKPRSPYKFSDEYYLPDASRKLAVEHKASDSCQKVYRDSMICTVCRNPHTDENAEQCILIGDPNKKNYSFSTSHAVGKPKGGKKSSNSGKKPAPIHENTESGEQGGELEKQSTQDVKDATGSSECRQVKKDSEICTVCKDPKTGGNSQRCTYNYEPDEKIYKFSRSKSFGYPESAKQEAPKEKVDKEVSESDPEEFTTYSDDSPEEDYSGYENPEAYSGYESLESSSAEESKENQNYDYDPDHVEYIRSESEKILKNAESENCRKVEKDSMVCSICKDPKTGEDSESCSYSYEPDDKKFAYSKSKSFGSPTKSRDEPEEYSGEESSENSGEGSYAYSEIKPTVSYPNRRVQLAADSNTQGTVFLGETEQPQLTRVDLGLLGASKKQARMEQLLKDDPNGNKTRCKKTMKNEMTCYQCVTDNGLRQEECMFIKNPENKSSSILINNPEVVKEVKLETQPVAAASDNSKTKKKKKKRPAKTEGTTNIPLEPTAVPTRRSYRLKRQSRRRSDNNHGYEKHDTDEQNYHSSESYNGKEKKNERSYETDPYEYVAETQYKYDKALGLKLPSHTLEMSDYEKEFDDVFYGDREKR